jgi:hypothetical protein
VIGLAPASGGSSRRTITGIRMRRCCARSWRALRKRG